MTIYTVRVAFDTTDRDAVDNIKLQVVQLLASAVGSVRVTSATLGNGDGPVVDLIDLADTYRTAQAQAQTVDQEPQAVDPPSQEDPANTAEGAIPTGKEF
jgi:hypothetical protein